MHHVSWRQSSWYTCKTDRVEYASSTCSSFCWSFKLNFFQHFQQQNLHTINDLKDNSIGHLARGSFILADRGERSAVWWTCASGRSSESLSVYDPAEWDLSKIVSVDFCDKWTSDFSSSESISVYDPAEWDLSKMVSVYFCAKWTSYFSWLVHKLAGHKLCLSSSPTTELGRGNLLIAICKASSACKSITDSCL